MTARNVHRSQNQRDCHVLMLTIRLESTMTRTDMSDINAETKQRETRSLGQSGRSLGSMRPAPYQGAACWRSRLRMAGACTWRPDCASCHTFVDSSCRSSRFRLHCASQIAASFLHVMPGAMQSVLGEGHARASWLLTPPDAAYTTD